MINYYIQQNNKILLADTDREKLETTLTFMPQYEGLEIQETERNIIILNDEFVFEDEHEEDIKKQEQEHIKSLTCTKRVFALMLQELGVDYITQLKPLIESNPQAQLEWDLCIELLRENPMLDLMASQLGITSEQLDALFLYANGEISKDDFELYKQTKKDL